MSNSDLESKAVDGVAGPVTDVERFESLDVLRGVAVLGILVMNIYGFAMPFGAYANPLLMGGLEPLNIGTWFFTHILFDQKFMSIFSMLFGAGVVLMAERAQERRTRFANIFFRRQFWLLILGLAHAYLIWFGDILFFYALVGAIAYFFRKLSPRVLIIVACVLLPVAPLLMHAGGNYMQDLKVRAEAIEARKEAGEAIAEKDQLTIDEWADERGQIIPGAEDLAKEVQAYNSNYTDILRYRAPVVFSFHVQALPFFIFWRVLALMLLGMALMKLGVFSGEQSAGFYRNLMFGAYIVGLPLTIYSAIDADAHAFEVLHTFKSGGWPNYFGSIFVALGHVGAIMMIVKTGGLVQLMTRFAAVGRMALTNYLMHSIVLTFVFYGYGLGLYGQVPRFWQMSFVVGLMGIQLVLSAWWLSHYRFGPVEWLWRSLSYSRRQPMRREQ